MKIIRTQTLFWSCCGLLTLFGCGATDDSEDLPVVDEQASIFFSECSPNPCGIGGTCADTLFGFECSCIGGFSGQLCDVAPVPSSPSGPAAPVIAGSATPASCSSYGKARGALCAGYYCAVTESQIASEVSAQNLCGEGAAALACDNSLHSLAAKCTREARSSNVLTEVADLRPRIEDCVYKSPSFQTTPPACVSCYLDEAQCEAERCLVQCLAGDSRDCDACRVRNNCHDEAISCIGLPSPF